jgi:thiol:disulfide interchange protein
MNVLALLLPVVLTLQPAPPNPPKIGLQLQAAHTSVPPGGQTELAIVVDVEKGWHAYYPLMVDAGAPTTVQFTVPAGVEPGELRFPVPELGEVAGIEYLGLAGRFVVLTTLKVDAGVAPGPLPIAIEFHALVCKELCVPVTLTARLELKVSADAPVATNTELFKAARAALPPLLGKAPYLEGSTVAISKEKLAVNEAAEVTVTVRVKKAHHIFDRVAGSEDMIASRLFVEQVDGMKVGEQLWPEPKVREIEGLGKLREQHGEVRIRVPVQIIDEKFAAGPVYLRVLFLYQCCTDAGTCFPPEMAEGVVRFVADTPNPPAQGGAQGTWLPLIARTADRPAPAVGSGAEGGHASPPVTPPPADGAGATTPLVVRQLLFYLVLGFVGGMILNITPCVFPVIALKVLGFVRQAGEDRRRVLRLGLAFCAGIMVWFWLFGLLTSLGQVPIQHPPVAIGLAAVLFVLALSLFGVYEIVLPGAASGKLGEASGREGYGGAFLNGFLATLLGTTCTAPLFAGAAAYAATQPRGVGLLVFTAAGLGMSLPYVLLAAFPAWLKRLPKPGPWMVTFKQVMGFALLATVVWLLGVIGKQRDVSGLTWTLAFFCFLGFAAWLIGRIQWNWDSGRRLRYWTGAVAVAALGLWFCLLYMHDLRKPPVAAVTAAGEGLGRAAERAIARTAAAEWNDTIPWQPYQAGLAEELAARGYTVFVDYTADWCINCKANETTAVNIPSTRALMKKLGVIPVLADFTKPSAEIRADLLKFRHNSVPMNLVYPAGRPSGVMSLPVLLTPGIVQEALDKAGPSRVKPMVAAARSQPS